MRVQAVLVILAVLPSTGSSLLWVRAPLETGAIVTAPGCGLRAQRNTGSWCKLTPVSVTMNADGKPVVAPATVLPDGRCQCRVPKVDAAGAASLSFSRDNKTFVPANVSVSFFATWSPSLGKRPYLSTDATASFVVATDAAAGSGLRISCPQFNLSVAIPTGAAVSVGFSLASLPAVYDGWVELNLSRPGKPKLAHRLRLMRVPVPPAQESFSYLDYSRRSIIVNDRPFNPVGFYSVWDPKKGDFEALLDDLVGQTRQGINVVMQYQASNQALNVSASEVGGCLVATPGERQQDCDNQTQILLDTAARHQLKVMIDLVGPFRQIVCGSFSPSSKQCPAFTGESMRGKAASTAGWRAVEATVNRYKAHPGLLGWYVCDDCMTSWIVAQRAAGTPTVDTLYNRLKQLDPHHIVIGAIESIDMFVFEAANVFVPEASLDVPMLENYVSTVAANADMGSAFHQPGNDGSIRAYPMAWQPMVNCPGPYAYDGASGRRPGITEDERADVTYSLSWVSAVTANMPSQLYFRRSYAGNTTGTLMRRAGQFAKQVAAFSEYIFVSPPEVANISQSPGFQQAGAMSDPAETSRAGLWVKPSANRRFCALLVVVNLQQRNESNSPVSQSITVKLSPVVLSAWPNAASAAAKSIDMGAASGEFKDGTFRALDVKGENTAVFQLSGDGGFENC